MTRQRVDKSLLSGGSITLFRAAIRNEATRDPYERRLINFLRKIEMDPDSFVNLAKSDPQVAEKKVISHIIDEVQRADEGLITESTIRNPLKAIKVLLEMNDVSLNWKKIRRLLPPARGYALDRIPTLDEIQDILDVADARGKALTLMFLTGGLREGAIESLRISDYSSIYSDGKIVAGKIVAYNGEPERYTTFITSEALNAIEKYLEFRRDHGEILGYQSPLFRDKFDPVKGMYGHGKRNAEKNVIPNLLVGLFAGILALAMIASIGTSNMAIATSEEDDDATWGGVTSGAATEDGKTNVGEHSSSFAGEERDGLGNILDEGQPKDVDDAPEGVGKDSDKHPDNVAEFVCGVDSGAAGCPDNDN